MSIPAKSYGVHQLPLSWYVTISGKDRREPEGRINASRKPFLRVVRKPCIDLGPYLGDSRKTTEGGASTNRLVTSELRRKCYLGGLRSLSRTCALLQGPYLLTGGSDPPQTSCGLVWGRKVAFSWGCFCRRGCG